MGSGVKYGLSLREAHELVRRDFGDVVPRGSTLAFLFNCDWDIRLHEYWPDGSAAFASQTTTEQAARTMQMSQFYAEWGMLRIAFDRDSIEARARARRLHIEFLSEARDGNQSDSYHAKCDLLDAIKRAASYLNRCRLNARLATDEGIERHRQRVDSYLLLLDGYRPAPRRNWVESWREQRKATKNSYRRYIHDDYRDEMRADWRTQNRARSILYAKRCNALRLIGATPLTEGR